MNRVAKHVVFWLIWISGFTFIQSFGFGLSDYLAWLFYYLVTLPVFLIHTYCIAYWLIPKYFFNHRFVWFSVWILIFLILSSVIELLISNELVWPLMKLENIQEGNYLLLNNVLINGIGNEYIVIVFLSVKVIRFWNSKMSERAILTNNKLQTEIELLQYQSYPRFVLNEMDRLENLARAKSPKTSEMIITLSNLMTNMITGRKLDKIPIQKELELIKSYLEIQRIGLPEKQQTELFVNGNLNGITVPPFLFFQLVEEGFLVLGEFSEKTEFTLHVKAESNYLMFSMTIWTADSLLRPLNASVLGNCRKILDYFYSGNHKLMSDFEVNFVQVTIEIYY